MTTQPEALRLADAIDPLIRQSLDNLTCSVAAAELRRLHAENEARRADAERLDWLMLSVSGKEFRRIGVKYSGNCNRAAIDAARSKT